jgi:hypothetical protein
MLDDRDQRKIEKLLDGVDPGDRAAMIAWMDRVRSGDRDDPHSGGFLAMVDLMKEGDVDQLTGIYQGLVQQIGARDTPEALNEFSPSCPSWACPAAATTGWRRDRCRPARWTTC